MQLAEDDLQVSGRHGYFKSTCQWYGVRYGSDLSRTNLAAALVNSQISHSSKYGKVFRKPFPPSTEYQNKEG